MSDDNYYATGRGGYGNVRKKEPGIDEPKFNPQEDTSKKTVSTGRGGAGNIRDRVDDDANALEPVTSSHNINPVASPTIGRGGYGNVKAGQNSAASLFAKAKGLFK